MFVILITYFLMRLMIAFFVTLAFCIVFPLFWIGIITLVAHLSGWATLARHYRTQEEMPSDALHWRSAMIGISRYNRVLTVAVTEEYIFLKPFVLFSFSHPPLRIPRSDIKLSKGKMFFIQTINLAVGSPPLATIKFYKNEFPSLWAEIS
jgi:hypothetical protein